MIYTQQKPLNLKGIPPKNLKEWWLAILKLDEFWSLNSEIYHTTFTINIIASADNRRKPKRIQISSCATIKFTEVLWDPWTDGITSGGAERNVQNHCPCPWFLEICACIGKLIKAETECYMPVGTASSYTVIKKKSV